MVGFMIFIGASDVCLWGADGRQAMEDIDGAIIEERVAPPSDSRLSDADATNPDGTYTPGAHCQPNEQQYNAMGVKTPINFTVSPYIGDQGECAKYNWATNLGIVWDGITYGVKNPCNT